MDKILEKFEQYLKLKGIKPTSYINRVKLFLKETPLENISQESINNYILKQKEKLSAKSVNLDISSIRAFMNFLNKNIVLPKNYKVKDVIQETITPKFFEDEILSTVNCVFPKPIKVKAILSFLFYTGARKNEIYMNLKRENINLNERTAKLDISKTNQELEVRFPKKTAKLINAYFQSEPEKDNAFNLTNSTIKHIFITLKPYFKDKVNLKPHLFRHSLATYLFEKNAPLKFIQKVLGHKSIQTTLKYTKLTKTQHNKLYDRYIK